MTWTQLGDDFNDRPANLLLSRSARLLHVESLVYANRHLTDGWIPEAALRRYTDAADVDSDVAELLRAGRWERHDSDRGWLIVGWADPDGEQQQPAAEVRGRRDLARERQRRHKLHKSGDHSLCMARYCAHVTRNETREQTRERTGSTTRSETPSQPNPTQPEGVGRVGGRPKLTLHTTARCDAHGKPYGADGTATCGVCPDREPLTVSDPGDDS